MPIFSSISSGITASKTGNRSIIAGRSISVSSLQALGKVLITYPETSPTLGGTLYVNGSSAGVFGYTTKTGNQTINSSYSESSWFNNDNDSSQCISVLGNLTIDSGYTLQPSTRKLFTLLYVQGNLVINGSISMSSRGANHGVTGNHGLVTPINLMLDSVGRYIPATGGSSGSGAGSNGGTGGGGNGGSWGGSPGGGAAGTCFSGGPGGGSSFGTGGVGTAGTAYGGAGGSAGNGPNDAKFCGGGAGNPGGSGAQGGAPGDTGTGGTLVIFVTGQISGSGSIVSNGANGGNPNGEQATDPGGGGSGGGSINIFYGSTSGTYTKTASGGSGGSSGWFATAGGAGGAGSIRTFAL